jgi:opacity protein-like surface antigen
MKTKYFCTILSLSLISISMTAQHVYPVTSGELIFSQSKAAFTQAFLTQYPGASLAGNNVRFTAFFHLGQYIHCDFNNNIGFFSGLGVRNVGMITDENLPQTVSATDGANVNYSRYNIVRRQYMLGVPLAIKLGSFKDHTYFFAGAEYEMAFHFKEKYWTDSFDRSGPKTKSTEWFSSQTPTFLPSLFAGVQFPGGVNLKFKYYLTDFLNSDYKVSSNSTDGSLFSISDLTRYESSQVFYFSVCWQFDTHELWDWHHE